MRDELGDEAPLVPQHEPDEHSRAASQAMSLPEADRKKLKSLLHELLRDNSLRELLCQDEELTPQFEEHE